MSVQIAAFRQALPALHSRPETPVGEAVVRFCGVEILCEFALRDVGDEADMRAGCLDGVETMERAEIAAIPSATEQGREVALGAPQGMENGGEFFREREQTTVRGRLLIAQSIDKGGGRQSSCGDAFGDPRVINFSKVASTMQWGAGPTALPNAASNWRRMAAGWASLCGAKPHTANPATP
jgi:hypothetical protein